MRVDTRDVNRVLKKGISLTKNPRRFLNEVGRNEINMSRRRIRTTKMDPNGRSWAPWSAATARSRSRRGTSAGGLLHETGKLHNSFDSHATNRTITITNRAPYATYLQNGTRNMPARAFLGWGRESISNIRKVFRKHMKRWR